MASKHPEFLQVLGIELPDTPTKAKKIRSVSPQLPGKTAVVRVSKERLLGGVIKLFTKHSLPFNALNWEGVHDILDPQLEPFGIKLNNRNISEYLATVRTTIDHIITEEVDGQMVALKFDSTTKRYRSVLGLNAQFYKNFILLKRTLGKLLIRLCL